eukprot:13586516-Alexandrium_andersonii.AAC.2
MLTRWIVRRCKVALLGAIFLSLAGPVALADVAGHMASMANLPTSTSRWIVGSTAAVAVAAELIWIATFSSRVAARMAPPAPLLHSSWDFHITIDYS